MFGSKYIRSLLPSNEQMKEEPAFDSLYVREATLVRIIDADSYQLEIDLGWDVKITCDVRLAGLNAPEKRGVERVAGQYVAGRVRDYITTVSGGVYGIPVKIVSQEYKRGKYGRCICDLWVDGECINDWLLTSRLAWKCDSTGSLIEERNVSNLNLPSHVIAEVRTQSLS